MSTVYTVTKLTPGQNQSFDDKTLTDLRPSLQTRELTDDLLSAYYQGRVSILPPPPQAEGGIVINPCQLPLPVRLIGGFQGLFTPTAIKAYDALIVGEQPTRMVGYDASRVNFRFRNSGSNLIAIGGVDVTFANAVYILQPGEIFNETFAPNVAWYAIAQIGLPSTLVGFAVQT